jgi:hypothetical protein
MVPVVVAWPKARRKRGEVNGEGRQHRLGFRLVMDGGRYPFPIYAKVTTVRLSRTPLARQNPSILKLDSTAPLTLQVHGHQVRFRKLRRRCCMEEPEFNRRILNPSRELQCSSHRECMYIHTDVRTYIHSPASPHSWAHHTSLRTTSGYRIRLGRAFPLFNLTYFQVAVV